MPKYDTIPLTQRQRRFVEEYFKDPSSITQAAIRAGMSSRSAYSQGRDLLNVPKVKAALVELETIRKHKLGISENRILMELCRIAFSDLGDILKEDENGNVTFSLKDLTPDQTAALSEYSKGRMGQKVKNYDKLAALDKIGKYLGMWREQVEIKGKLSLEELVMKSMKKEDEPKEEENDVT